MKHPEVLARAQSFIYHNARLLERARFAWRFEEGSTHAVYAALAAYQNEDGGFGHALEPDIRCPASQPVPLEMAMLIMDEIGAFDPAISAGILRWMSTHTQVGGGWPLILPSVTHYPHAPWWIVPSDKHTLASVNPSGSLLALAGKWLSAHGALQERWFVESMDWMWQSMEQHEPEEYHQAVHWIQFLQQFGQPDDERTQRLQEKLSAWLATPGVIEHDPQAEGYVHKVLDWAPTPKRAQALGIDESLIDAHLDAWIAQQADDGGWPLHFPALSPAAEMEWRGVLTMERLKTLHAYGRL